MYDDVIGLCVEDDMTVTLLRFLGHIWICFYSSFCFLGLLCWC